MLAQVVETLDKMSGGLADCQDLLDMAVEENDEGAASDVVTELQGLEESLAQLEFRRMFSGEMDMNNAYLDIQAGSGGTEAQDWANILLRMYLRWADKRGFDATIIELSEGEVAGIKGATVHIKGEYAFGWLRTEIGVHRLVRKSPFDSGARRHTSFSAVFVSPEIDDKVEIDINPSDLRVDTYRSSGAGGQHVNTTDSAVRITHVPTNTVVACQNERSQHANKDTAMKMLRAKLYELEMQKRNAASQALEDSKSDIGWGHQIRSYVLMTRVSRTCVPASSAATARRCWTATSTSTWKRASSRGCKPHTTAAMPGRPPASRALPEKGNEYLMERMTT